MVVDEEVASLHAPMYSTAARRAQISKSSRTSRARCSSPSPVVVGRCGWKRLQNARVVEESARRSLDDAQDEIAGMVGSVREVVQRALKALASVRITSERSSMKRNGRVIDDSACTSAIAC
jgi:hypothetical protein